ILGQVSDCASTPEARAQCGSSARWDLRGGRPEPRGEGRPYRDRTNASRFSLIPPTTPPAPLQVSYATRRTDTSGVDLRMGEAAGRRESRRCVAPPGTRKKHDSAAGRSCRFSEQRYYSAPPDGG